ncbi:tyrosine-type recombinase/integrase [Candidatus Uhrbacteria bacterium]|nr:tyrosine-type recombinase/integrase [Candidatus Uhrbacteria bacterium]
MQKPTPAYYIDFLEYSEVEKGLSLNTIKNYGRFLKSFITWLKLNNLATITPREITAEHIQKYRLWLARRPNKTRKLSPSLSSSTQSRYLIALRMFFAFFHERDIESLPTEKIKLPKERRERLIKFLDGTQVDKLCQMANPKTSAGLRDRAILESLFSTGLRVAELAALDRKQFEGVLHAPDFEVSIIGKGGYTRTVYFSQQALMWVRTYLSSRNDDYEPLFIRFKGPQTDSKRLTTRAIEGIVQKYAKKAGLPFLATPHTLRHSFATDLLTQGVDLRTVQEFLGHRNIATTQVYTHITSKRLRDIHRKFHHGGKTT